MTTTRHKANARSGRRFAQLIAVLNERIKSPKETISREAIETLTRILIHVDEIEDKKAARAARAKAGIPEPAGTPDPAKLADTVAQLRAELSQGQSNA